MNKFSNIKERALSVAKKRGVSYESFSESIGMTYGSFKGSAKNRPLNSDAIENILTKYNVNARWLITGEGEMDYTDDLDLKKKLDYDNDHFNENTTVYKLRTDSNREIQHIPLYNIEATAGLVDLFQNNSDQSPIDTIKIPNLPKCDGALYVSGDSMYPLLKSGDIVAYKQIQDFKNDVFWGEMYLVSVEVGGEEYVSVKYVQKSEKGEAYIKLVSQNQHHQPKDVMLEKVRAMALIKASIRINSMQ